MGQDVRMDRTSGDNIRDHRDECVLVQVGTKFYRTETQLTPMCERSCCNFFFFLRLFLFFALEISISDIRSALKCIGSRKKDEETLSFLCFCRG